MLRFLLAVALLVGLETESHAFWGALVKGAAKAGKAASTAGKAAGAAKVAKPVAAGAVAGGLADDAARGAGRAGSLGDDAARGASGSAAHHADDAPSVSGAAAAEAEPGSSLGEHALDVASNVTSFAEEDGADLEATSIEEDDALFDGSWASVVIVGGGLLALGLGFLALRSRRG